MRVSVDLLNLRGDRIRGREPALMAPSDVLIGIGTVCSFGLERTGLNAARTQPRLADAIDHERQSAHVGGKDLARPPPSPCQLSRSTDA